MAHVIEIGIVHYPGALLSAVQGLAELFYLANKCCEEHQSDVRFKTQLCDLKQIAASLEADELPTLNVIILPPCLEDRYYSEPDERLLSWLLVQHKQGALLCSVCAGAFVLAKTGLLQDRPATTHWALADHFCETHPDIKLNAQKLLVNDGDLITAGGLMSWVDLGLELVAQHSSSQIMRALGKYLIVDTAPREQRYYRSFKPKLDHGDEVVLSIQHHLQGHFSESVVIKGLAERCYLTERTFLRRFMKATGLKPSEYLQRLRIQKACDLLEGTRSSIAKIAEEVGYEDISAFRKTFVKVTGQTPKAFRDRFAS